MAKGWDKRQFKQELKATMANLKWLGDRAEGLSHAEIYRHLKESVRRQQKILAYIEEHFSSGALEGPLEQQFEELRDGQQELLLKFAQRLYFRGVVDGAEAIGKENICQFVLSLPRQSRRSRSP